MAIEITDYRVSKWVDTSRFDVEEFPIRYGVEAKAKPGGWRHCARDGKALIFDTPEEAEAEIELWRCHK